MVKIRLFSLIIILIWVLTACVDITTTQEPTATPEIQVTFFTPELTLTETSTNEQTETVTATPTATDTPLPTSTETPTETDTPEPTQTLTPTLLIPTEIPTITSYPTPTRVFQGFPIKFQVLGIPYIPRGSLRLRDCPYLDNVQCPWHERYITNTTPVYCIWYNSETEVWGSPDQDCMNKSPVTWFAIFIGTVRYADEQPGPKGE